ncbi:MAG: L-threonylcarbamoyladenylate synthase [Actinomycetota bacterium]
MVEIIRFQDVDQDALLWRCEETLAAGGLLVMPTDTVYGLVARADMAAAAEAVFAAKGRDAEKSLVVMVAGVEEAALLAAPQLRGPLRKLASFWPGPLTLVVEAGDVPWRSNVAPASGSLGIRVPDSPFLLRLLARSGPLAVTSANMAGEKEPAGFAAIDPRVLAAAALALDAEESGSGTPSTVAEIKEGAVSVLRQGAITEDELNQALMAGERGGHTAHAS